MIKYIFNNIYIYIYIYIYNNLKKIKLEETKVKKKLGPTLLLPRFSTHFATLTFKPVYTDLVLLKYFLIILALI